MQIVIMMFISDTRRIDINYKKLFFQTSVSNECMSQMSIRILGISIYVNARDAKTVSSFKLGSHYDV